MTVIFDPSVPLGTKRPWIHAEDALATRVRMVLETSPGTLPWRPEFGCDLSDLIGFPATEELLTHAKWRILTALQQWIPDASIDDVVVRVASAADQSFSRREATVPLAETALLTLGVQAVLHVDIEMTGPAGPVALSTLIAP